MPFRREPFPFVPLPGTAYEPNENGWKLWWVRLLEGERAALTPLFDAYSATYRDVEARSKEYHQWVRDWNHRSPDERYTAGYDPHDALMTIEAERGTLKVALVGVAPSVR